MKNRKETVVLALILVAVTGFLTQQAEGMDPEALSRVSQAIAEWNLVGKGRIEDKSQPLVHVSSALSPAAARSGGSGTAVVSGLSAFGDYNWQQSGTQWDYTPSSSYSNWGINDWNHDYNWQWSQTQWDYDLPSSYNDWRINDYRHDYNWQWNDNQWKYDVPSSYNDWRINDYSYDYNWQLGSTQPDYNWRSSYNDWSTGNWQWKNSSNWDHGWPSSNYHPWQQARSWELDASVSASNQYMSRLPGHTPWRTGAEYLGSTYSEMVRDRTFNWYLNSQLGVVNVLRSAQGELPLTTFPNSWRAASTMYTRASAALTVFSTGVNAATTFFQTVDYVGRSMQVMNPPVYLRHDPERGLYAEKTPAGWKGWGRYSVPGGTASYQERIEMSAPRFWRTGTITRTHFDQIRTDFGTYERTIEIHIPDANPMQRFAMHHYPVGDYFSENASYTITTTIHEAYRTQTINGVTTRMPIDYNLGGSINYSHPTYQYTMPPPLPPPPPLRNW
jgi:hypothetical protein